tara:strand:- start:270 stop:473 length:204 start_codon:yes stop_codon:yes gene_type:complete
VSKDRSFLKDFLYRALLAGLNTLIVIADFSVFSVRYLDYHSGLVTTLLTRKVHRFFKGAHAPYGPWK